MIIKSNINVLYFWLSILTAITSSVSGGFGSSGRGDGRVMGERGAKSVCIVDTRAVARLCEVWSLGEDWDDGQNEVIRVAAVDEEIAVGAMNERIGVSHVEEVIGVVVAEEVLGFDMIGEVIEEKVVEVMVGGEVNTVAEVDEALDAVVQDKVGVVEEVAVAYMHVAGEEIVEVVVDKVMGVAV